MCCVCQYGEHTTNIENGDIQLTEPKWQMVFTYVQLTTNDNKCQVQMLANVSNWQVQMLATDNTTDNNKTTSNIWCNDPT